MLDRSGCDSSGQREEKDSQLMEQAIQKARELPEPDQDAIASIMLQKIESEQRWEKLFSKPQSADVLSRLADEALAEVRAGRATQLDINEL
jgi:hypothetical protein